MALGIAYFGANGYTVSIPLNDTQWYDFVIEKEVFFSSPSFVRFPSRMIEFK